MELFALKRVYFRTEDADRLKAELRTSGLELP